MLAFEAIEIREQMVFSSFRFLRLLPLTKISFFTKTTTEAMYLQKIGIDIGSRPPPSEIASSLEEEAVRLSAAVDRLIILLKQR